MDCQGALAAAIIVAGAFYIVNSRLGVKYTQLPITAKQIWSKIKRLPFMAVIGCFDDSLGGFSIIAWMD